MNQLTPSHDALASSFATTYAGVMAFIAVVTEGSFARAADRLGVGRSAVSRSVQKLEDQLSVRLFLRTTRSTTLTHEGELFHARCHTGVDHIIEAVKELRELREGPPRGRLRISAPVSFGRKVVAPLLGDFRAAYPEVSIDLVLCDKPADFISDRVDIAFRDGRMVDADIIAKKIMPMEMLVCASPKYRRFNGLPDALGDLSQHRCINFRLASGRVFEWEFKVDGELRKFLPEATLTFNDADLVLQAVLDGHGIAQIPAYLAREPLQAEALVAALTQYAPDDRGHYICYLSRQHLPSRMRVFIDFMTSKIRALNAGCAPKNSVSPFGDLQNFPATPSLPPRDPNFALPRPAASYTGPEKDSPRRFVRDPQVRYFGGILEDEALVPGASPRIGALGVDACFAKAPGAAETPRRAAVAGGR